MNRRSIAQSVLAVAALLLIATGLGARAAAAAPLTVKLATLVPDGSVWDKELKTMGSEWRRETEGRVALQVYPGGVAGDEPDVLRKMRIGQLHAASLTVRGLSEIDEGFEALAIPLFYDSYDELFHVLRALEPELRRRARAAGYELIQWGHAGWVHVFSTEPVREVDDLKQLKLFVSAGDDDMVQWWKSGGFHPVALAMTDILTGLQTGMIEVVPTTPLAALSLQWFRRLPYMNDTGLAPLVGATVISTRMWNRIGEGDRERLSASALAMQRRLEQQIPAQDRTAIAEMKERGLEVTSTTDAEQWRATARQFADSMRGSRVPAEVFDMAVEARDAYRRRQAAEGGS